nr:MAG TPA: Cytochrome oxidase maturation protein cbb3-type [Caudoviricetes sp.]
MLRKILLLLSIFSLTLFIELCILFIWLIKEG